MSASENRPFTLRVECHAGHRGAEYPVRFQLGDRWLDPAYRYFKLRGDDEGIYILRHDAASNAWTLVMFDSGSREDTKLSST